MENELLGDQASLIFLRSYLAVCAELNKQKAVIDPVTEGDVNLLSVWTEALDYKTTVWLVVGVEESDCVTVSKISLGPKSLMISFSSAARTDFLRCNLSPLLLFSHTNNV